MLLNRKISDAVLLRNNVRVPRSYFTKVEVHTMFDQVFVTGPSNRRPWGFAVSLTGQSLLVVAAAMTSVVVTDSISKVKTAGSLVYPSTPPPLGTPSGVRPTKARPAPKRLDPTLLSAPRVVPNTVPRIFDEVPDLAVNQSGPGDAVGDRVFGDPRGVPNGILNELARNAPVAEPVPTSPPAVAVPATPKQIQVGGRVQSARILFQPKPLYPAMAKSVRAQGVVKLSAVIGVDGSIKNLTLVSGHPLLVSAALEAVKQWRYQPTTLNGDPVEVLTTIDVNFTLQQ